MDIILTSLTVFTASSFAVFYGLNHVVGVNYGGDLSLVAIHAVTAIIIGSMTGALTFELISDLPRNRGPFLEMEDAGAGWMWNLPLADWNTLAAGIAPLSLFVFDGGSLRGYSS